MCGIIGYTGDKEAVWFLLNGLERLEYRGYDSTGVAVVSPQGNLQIKKKKGRLSALTDYLNTTEQLCGTVGIGHTRWATHGKPNNINAHPHTGQSGKIAVVHNGIIENYLEIKNFLVGCGVRFQTDTDTEVIVQLMEYFYSKNPDITEAVYSVLQHIKGAYAMGIVCSDYPEQIIAVKKDAPLLIGYGDGCNFIASDVTALLSHTRQVSYMEDGEVAFITSESVNVLDSYKKPVEKQKVFVEWDVSLAEKDGYAHFMLKEIMEQPQAVKNTVSSLLKDGEIYFETLERFPDLINNIFKIFIVACGSAYHVGVVGKYTLEKLTGIPVEACLASEFRYSSPLADNSSLVIIISQSGETSDSMAALREAKTKGAKTLAIVNVVGSSIAREADIALYTAAGPEIAVATTKAYNTQLVLLTMLGVYFSKKLNIIGEVEYYDIINALQQLPQKISLITSDKHLIQKLASEYFNHSSAFYIGRNIDYAMGLEGSLKLKEISYIHSEAYAAGELKHGTISLMEKGVLVLALATYDPLKEKTLSNILEVKSRGADIIVLTLNENRELFSQCANNIITIPETHELLLPSLSIVPLQLFAYYMALNKGCDIDKPRNLAKSVTVE